MNELIEKLAKQAFGSTIDTDPILVYEAENFAELIVQECVNWIDGSPATEEGTLILSKSFIIANLKQHFGV